MYPFIYSLQISGNNILIVLYKNMILVNLTYVNSINASIIIHKIDHTTRK